MFTGFCSGCSSGDDEDEDEDGGDGGDGGQKLRVVESSSVQREYSLLENLLMDFPAKPTGAD